jgi:glycosyltransferase involved in cell wall biosynthesis
MLTIFILCHNRPDDAQQAISSAIAQSCPADYLVISDNSSNDSVELMVKTHFPHVHYVRRPLGLNALEHFNMCIDEASTDYFCLFHDDDLMLPDFVKKMKLASERYPNAVAIGCNAYIQEGEANKEDLSFRAMKSTVRFKKASDLVSRYFGRNQSGIAPFPGYIYKRQLVHQERFQPGIGKYGDVAWLIALSQFAQIIWVTTPLMIYRMHGKNDGLKESRKDRLKLLSVLKFRKTILDKGLLDDYRVAFIYKPILQNEFAPSSRKKLAGQFLYQYRIHRYLRGSTYKNLISRARLKLGGFK